MALDCVPLWIQAVYFALQFRGPIFPKVIFGTKFKFSENQNTLRFHYTWPNAITSTNIKALCPHCTFPAQFQVNVSWKVLKMNIWNLVQNLFTNCGGARDGISYGHQRRMQSWNHRPDGVIATNYAKAENGAHGCKSSIGSPNTKSVHASKTSRIPRITKKIIK